MFCLKISNTVELYRLRFDHLNNEQIFATKDTLNEKEKNEEKKLVVVQRTTITGRTIIKIPA
jgi:hypothetical protein